MRRALVLTVLAAIAVGCGEPDPPPPPPPPPAGWTVMVYLLADNNLEEAGLSDLVEMMQVGSTSDFNIVALVDRAAPGVQGDTSLSVGGLSNWTGGKYIQVRAGSLESVRDLGEPDMGNPATLSSFIDWAADRAPAERYALIFWDHGGAWPKFGDDEGNGGSGLNIPQLKQGIANGMQQAGIQQFGIIGFDACLMGTLEVAQALRPHGEYLLASEEIEPGHGWDYRSFAAARNNPDINPLDLSKAVVSGYYAQAQAENDVHMVTLSVTDLGALGPLVTAVKNLGTALQQKGAVAGRAREDALAFGDNPNPSLALNQVDLGDLVTRLAALDPSLSPQAQAVQAALAGAVRDQVHGVMKSRATGLSVYFPPNSSYYDPAYDQLADSGDWRTFLKAFFAEGAALASKPQFLNANHQGQLGYSGGNLVLSGTLAPGTFANVVGVSLSYGIVDQANGVVFLVGDKPGSVDGSGVTSGSWNVSLLRVSQGASYDYGYLSINAVAGGNYLVQIPLAYTPAGSTQNELILFAVVIDTLGNELARHYFAESNGAWSELTPEPGSKVQTAVMQVDVNTGQTQWVLVNAVSLDPTQPLDISFASLQAGTAVFLMLEATDFGGSGDYVIGTGTL